MKVEVYSLQCVQVSLVQPSSWEMVLLDCEKTLYSAVALLFKWQIFFILLNLIWKHKFSITSVIKLFIPFPELLSGAVTTWIFLLWLFFWQLLGKHWQAICCLIWNLLMNQCFLSNPHSNVTSEYELFTIQWLLFESQ